MPELQQVNSTPHSSPFSNMLEFDKDLKFSCNAPEKYPESSLSNSQRLLSDFENLLTGLPVRGHAAAPETIEDRLTQLQTPFSYPSTFEYAELAHRAYAEQHQGGELKDRLLPNGWSLLTTAYNDDLLTSYFGAAYWNSTKRQVVISHRGTVFKVKKEIIGTLLADIQGIFLNQHTPQVNSAVTFAYEVATVLRQINKNNPELNIQLSFTGHSLGGWLAQITAFTTKYLEKVDNYFLKDKNFQKNGLHARVVVFESPGCKEKLQSLQDNFEVRLKNNQFGNNFLAWEALDITNYLSGPNFINTCNHHVGTGYRVFIDLSEEENVDRALYYTRIMHKMPKIKEALSEFERTTKISRVIDWPLLGQPSCFEPKGYLECAFEIFEYCAPYCLPEPLPTVVESVGFINRLYQYYKNTGEYRKIFEDLNRANNYDTSPDKILNSLGFARIRYQTEPVGDEDRNKCAKSVFTDDEWQFLLRYRTLCAQPNSARMCEQVFSGVFNDNEHAVTKTIRVLSLFTIVKEVIIVKPTNIADQDNSEELISLEKFISYVKHMLHLFPALHKDEQLKSINIYYQSESFLYIQSSILDFFKENAHQPVLQESPIVGGDIGSEVEVTEKINASSYLKKDIINLNLFRQNDKSRVLYLTHPDSLVAVNVIYDIYQGIFKNNSGDESKYAFFSLEHILKSQYEQFYEFLNGIKAPYLLVIVSDKEVCEKGRLFFKELFGVLENNKHIKLVLVSRGSSLNDFLSKEDSKKFANLCTAALLEIKFDDLTEAAQAKILEREIIVQGKAIALEELITRQDDEIKELFDSKTLMALIKNEKIELGKPVPSLGEIENYYIDRKFYYKVKIKENVFSEYSTDKFFIVGIYGKDELSRFVERDRIKYYSDIERDPDQSNQNSGVKFILLDGNQSAANSFKYLSERYSDQTIHWLSKETNGDLVWYQSQGSILRLRKYLEQSRDTDDLIEDKKIIENSELANKLIIIAAEPGMGKSTVLTRLANQEKEKNIFKWVLRVDLKNYKERLNQNPFKSTDDIIQFLDEINGSKNGLSKKLLGHFIKNKGNVVLLLDGFDEIEKNQQNNVIKLIEELGKTNVERVIVSTRLHERENLENKFLVFTHSFRKFGLDDQAEFLNKFWKKNILINTETAEGEKKEILFNQYIDELLKSFYKSSSINNAAKGFMGIPLQTKMIAEIYQTTIERSLAQKADHFIPIKDLGLLKLYEKFVQCKYDLYFKEKRGISVLPDSIEKSEWTASFAKMHRRLAMRLLFPRVSEDMQVLLGNKLLQAHGKMEKLNLIGILQVTVDKVDVAHLSYAEYFAADFLNNMLQKQHNTKKYNHTLSFLSKEIFKPENEVIRTFLDCFLTSKITRYEACLADIKHKLIDIPHAIPSKALVSRLHDEVASMTEEKGFSELIELIKQLLKELKVESPSAEEIDGFLLKIKHCINNLSSVASLNRRLRCAANEGDLYTVNELLENAKIDDTDNMGRTALHYAAQKGDREIVEALLTKGFKVEALDGCGRDAIHYAARYNDKNAEAMECLLAHAPKAIIDQQDYQGLKDPTDPKKNQGFAPLYYSVKQGYWHLVSALIKKGAKSDGVLNKGELLFHYIFANDFPTIKSLLSDVSNVNQYRDNQKNGLLHVAAQIGSPQIVSELLEKGIGVQARNKYGERAIHIAAQNAHWEVVTRLLTNKDEKKRADFNDLDDKQKDSLLEYSKENKSLDWLKLFFQDGNKGNYFNAFNLSEQEKIDSLCQFICSGDLDIAALFIDKGTKIDTPDSKGKKPIQYAAECAHWNIVEHLLSKQAALFDKLNNLNEKYVESLFNYSVEHVHLNIVKIFIENSNGQNYFNKLTNQQRRNCLNHLIFVGTSKLEAKKTFIDTLIEKEVDINSQDGDGKTLLHQAAQYQQLAIVRYLVEDKQADIHAKDNEGHTPLYYAVIKAREDGNVEVVKYLLEKEAGCELPYKLHYAAERGYYEELIEALLTEEGTSVNARNNFGVTPLHLAAENGHLETVKYLVEKKQADIHATDQNGHTPLYYAAKNTQANANVEVVKYLLEKEAGCELPYKLHYAAERGYYEELIEALLTEEGTNVNARNNFGVTPLHLAAENGHLETVKYLVEKKQADIHATDQNGHTPLYYAAKNTQGNVNIEVVKYLLEKEAGCELLYKLHYATSKRYKEVAEALLTEEDADVDVRNDFGATPLHMVVGAGGLGMLKRLTEKMNKDKGVTADTENEYKETPLHLAVGKLLIEKGAAIDVKDEDEKTPLHLAAEYGYEAIAKLLIEESINQGKVATINAQDNDNRTPLHMAANEGHAAIAELLIKSGAAVDAKDKDKKTPLHMAADHFYLDVVRVLINNAATVTAKDIDKWGLLHRAIRKGHQELVWLLIKKGAAVNARNNFEEETPLYLAVGSGHLAAVKLLIENGAKVNVKNRYGDFPLYRAAVNGYEAIAQLLIKSGAAVDAKADDKNSMYRTSSDGTSLHGAAENGYLSIVKLLIENGAEIDVKDNCFYERTPLHRAAGRGHLGIVKLLIERLIKKGKRAAVDAKDKDIRTPLHLAAVNGCEAVAELLIKKGAEVDAKDKDIRTPLHLAAVNGHEAVAELLIKNGAVVDVKDNNFETPLHCAAERGHLGVAKLLIEELIKKGKRAAVDAKDKDIRTPLHLAAVNGHEAVAELLIKNGAVVDVKDNNFETPLHCAAERGHLGVAKLLIEELIKKGKKAEVDAKDKDIRTPLHLAAVNGHEAVAELLIKKGAVIDAKDNNFETPLHWAAKKGREAVVKLLIKNEAMVEVKNSYFKKTPLHLAAEEGHEAVAKLLIEGLIRKGKKAEVDVKDKDNRTPLHLAAKNGRLETVIYLVGQGADVKSKDKDGGTPLDLAKNQQIFNFLRLSAKSSYDDKSNSQFSRASSGATFFKKEGKSDNESQNQSHSTQQQCHNGGG